VFVNAFWGPRRILLPAAAIFTVASFLLPFSPNYQVMMALVIVAGLASGTFYSLTMTFVLTNLPKRLIIYGIAAYAADIVFVSNIASLLEGWYIDHRSWRWIFWTAAFFTPLMMACIYFGIPRRTTVEPRPSWRGFTYFSFSLALLYGVLDQGQRLDWLNSGTIVGMLVAGLFLLGAAILRLATSSSWPHPSSYSSSCICPRSCSCQASSPTFNTTGRWRPDTRSPG
jgi:DHA2 family multidrug resistance protein